MLRKILLAGSVAIPLGLLGAAPALADTDFEVHFGVPFYSYQVDPSYVYYDDYGWHDADAYPDFRVGYYDDDRDNYDDNDDNDYVVVAPSRLSCGEARRIVRAHGYHNVDVDDCDGGTYTFTGVRDGEVFTIYVNSRNGRMWHA
jgi:hypothetical protein